MIDNVTRLRLSRAWKTARGLISRSMRQVLRAAAFPPAEERGGVSARRSFSDWPHNGLRFIGKAASGGRGDRFAPIFTDFWSKVASRSIGLERVNGRASEDRTESGNESGKRVECASSYRADVMFRDRGIARSIDRSSSSPRTIGEMNDYF
jgi:hypothetical protein